jgi:hypothetical protein
VNVAIDDTEASPSYVYNLDYAERGRIPDNLVYHARASDVAAVDLGVHGGRPTYYEDYPFTFQADEDFSARGGFELFVPHATREYFGPIAPRHGLGAAVALGIRGLARRRAVERLPEGGRRRRRPLRARPGAGPGRQRREPRFRQLCAGCPARAGRRRIPARLGRAEED